MRIRLDQIVFDAGTQIRAAISEQVVSDYALDMTEDAIFPPVVLFHDGNRYYMADGFHRGLASQRNKFIDIEADVRPGTQADALWFALGANRKNGAHMTPQDKKHAILLALEAWPEKSSRVIAEQIGVNDSYVRDVTRQAKQVGDSTHVDRVTGKDGKSYPVSRAKESTDDNRGKPAKTKTAQHERWSRAREMAAEGYSTRQIADEFGIGIEGLRVRLREHGIDVPADRIIGKSKHHDSNRIVEQMAADAENLTADVNLIDFSAIDHERLGDWIDTFVLARRSLEAFTRRLMKEKEKHGEAA